MAASRPAAGARAARRASRVAQPGAEAGGLELVLCRHGCARASSFVVKACAETGHRLDLLLLSRNEDSNDDSQHNGDNGGGNRSESAIDQSWRRRGRWRRGGSGETHAVASIELKRYPYRSSSSIKSSCFPWGSHNVHERRLVLRRLAFEGE